MRLRVSNQAIVITGVVLMAYAWHAHAGGASSSEAAVESQFGNLVEARLAAFDRGDADAYRKLISPEFVHIDDRGQRRTGNEVLARVSANTGSQGRHEVGDVHVRQLGDIAIVDAAVTELVRLGARDLPLKAHELDVFVKKEGGWLLLEHAETPVVVSPTTDSPSPAELDQYVGRYEWWAGYTEQVTRQGKDLYVGQVGEASSRLVPASHESFFIPGDPSLVVFARDANGRVTHFLVHFADGQVVRARRID